MARSIYQGKNYDYVYGLDNYIIESRHKITTTNVKSPICVIYCSSSGLYYPNTEEEFVKAFVDRDDKYEWRNNRIRQAEKSIWIRDITKEFYIRGINKRINTIDKLVDFLKEDTKGYDIITVGSSGGGYIATVLGCALNAKRVYCFSGFFNLDIVDAETWPLVAEYGKHEEYHKWYNLRNLIQTSGVKVFYFYPNKLEGDRKQAEIVRGLSNVYTFQYNSDRHGIPFKDRWHIPILHMVLNMSERRLLKLFNMFREKGISSIQWNYLVVIFRLIDIII